MLASEQNQAECAPKTPCFDKISTSLQRLNARKTTTATSRSVSLRGFRATADTRRACSSKKPPRRTSWPFSTRCDDDGSLGVYGWGTERWWKLSGTGVTQGQT